MWYLDSNNNFKWSTDPEIVTYNAMLQELQLWKGENPTNINAGIDYQSIFEGKIFAKNELQTVIDKYTSSFVRLELGEAENSVNGEIVSFGLTVEFKDGTVLKKTISL